MGFRFGGASFPATTNRPQRSHTSRGKTGSTCLDGPHRPELEGRGLWQCEPRRVGSLSYLGKAQNGSPYCHYRVSPAWGCGLCLGFGFHACSPFSRLVCCPS